MCPRHPLPLVVRPATHTHTAPPLTPPLTEQDDFEDAVDTTSVRSLMGRKPSLGRPLTGSQAGSDVDDDDDDEDDDDDDDEDDEEEEDDDDDDENDDTAPSAVTDDNADEDKYKQAPEITKQPQRLSQTSAVSAASAASLDNVNLDDDSAATTAARAVAAAATMSPVPGKWLTLAR